LSSQESVNTPGRHNSFSQESRLNFSQENQQQQQVLSQQTVDTVETVESAARVTEMQKRADELMKEKMGIAMAMAPLEARFRQNG
jgi:hypothetical protein